MKLTNDKKNALSGVQTVVFDLDGTLYNKRGLAARMVRRLWWCLPLMLIDRHAKGRVWRWIVSTRWHREVYLKTMVDLIGNYCPRREDVMTLIEECKEQGLQMAIYSDYGCMAEKMKALNIPTEPFELLIDAPSLGALKPSAACARKVLEMLHADPETTLFVGDRDEKDGESARMIGAKFLLV